MRACRAEGVGHHRVGYCRGTLMLLSIDLPRLVSQQSAPCLQFNMPRSERGSTHTPPPAGMLCTVWSDSHNSLPLHKVVSVATYDSPPLPYMHTCVANSSSVMWALSLVPRLHSPILCEEVWGGDWDGTGVNCCCTHEHIPEWVSTCLHMHVCMCECVCAHCAHLFVNVCRCDCYMYYMYMLLCVHSVCTCTYVHGQTSNKLCYSYMYTRTRHLCLSQSLSVQSHTRTRHTNYTVP